MHLETYAEIPAVAEVAVSTCKPSRIEGTDRGEDTTVFT
jgi:hypothetical protein